MEGLSLHLQTRLSTGQRLQEAPARGTTSLQCESSQARWSSAGLPVGKCVWEGVLAAYHLGALLGTAVGSLCVLPGRQECPQGPVPGRCHRDPWELLN